MSNLEWNWLNSFILQNVICVGGANKIKRVNPIHLGDYIESNEFAYHDHVTKTRIG
jgi:hypothetical protein